MEPKVEGGGGTCSGNGRAIRRCWLARSAVAVRGATAAEYAQGANVAVTDPKVLDMFPDDPAVKQALRALTPILRQQRRSATKQRNA